jgi:hypothetical protein
MSPLKVSRQESSSQIPMEIELLEMKSLYVNKLSSFSLLASIEPTLLKLWNHADRPQYVTAHVQNLGEVPMTMVDSESFFQLLGTMQLQLMLENDGLSASVIDEFNRFGMRVTERKRYYSFRDFKNESVKMFGAGLVMMTDRDIELAFV